MARKALIRIQNPPTEPSYGSVIKKRYIEEGDLTQDLPYGEIQQDCSHWEPGFERLYVEYEVAPSEEEIQKRRLQYEKALAKYNAWYKKNEKLIVKELKVREQARLLRKKSYDETRKKKMLKELAQKKAQYEQLKKELGL